MRRRNTLPIVGLMATLFSLCALAEETAQLDAFPDAPPPPPRVESGEALEPEVTIIRKGDETVTEYRLNGRLHMVKVEPKNAPVYYLVDGDGDGELETRRSELTADMMVPNWVLFSW